MKVFIAIKKEKTIPTIKKIDELGELEKKIAPIIKLALIAIVEKVFSAIIREKHGEVLHYF